MRKKQNRTLCRYASIVTGLFKSNNVTSPNESIQLPGNNTCNLARKTCNNQLALPKRSADRVNFSFQAQPAQTTQYRIASTRRKEHSIDKEKHELNRLYSGLYKLKHSHLRTQATAQQKDRFMRKLGQTIKADEFRAVGYELDSQCCVILFDYLKSNNGITKITLDNNPLGDQGVLKLSQVVYQINLEELSLVSVGMGNKGAAALFTGLSIKCTIKKLNISSMECTYKNKITAEGVNNLQDLLTAKYSLLNILHMDYVSLGNQGLKSAFQGVQNSPLQELTLSRNEITSKRIPNFSNGIANINLLRLDLSRNSIGNEGCKYISELLGLSYGKNRISVNLIYLNLSNNSINSLGLQVFCRDMCANQTLQTLILDNNSLSEGDQFFSIKYYLTKSWSLKKLSLISISCYEKDIKFLTEGVLANRSIEQLNFSKNQIDFQSFSGIFEMLSRNKSLKRLKLNNCKICDNYFLKNEFQIIGFSYQNIEQIELQDSYIGNKGAEILHKFILSNVNVLRLSLTRNCVGEKLLISINQTLYENQRKRPFDKEFKTLELMSSSYEQKKKELKDQIQKGKNRELFLQNLMIVGDIRNREIFEDNLNSQIKNEKRSIKRIKRKRRDGKIDKAKKNEPTDDNGQFVTAFSNHSEEILSPLCLTPQISIRI